jgi:hypothetical protein
VHLRPADAEHRIGLLLIEHRVEVGVDMLKAPLLGSPAGALLDQIADGDQLDAVVGQLRMDEAAAEASGSDVADALAH